MILNESHLRILRALQKNCALPLDQLAKAISISQSTLWRRIQELDADGVIVRRIAVLDPRRMGLTVCAFVNINLVSQSVQHRDDFQALVQETREITQCYSVTGPHDYCLIIWVRDIESYEELLMNKILSHPSVASASSNIVLRQQKYTTELPI
jgi:Lrp/AsnC family transcriptional regulator